MFRDLERKLKKLGYIDYEDQKHSTEKIIATLPKNLIDFTKKVRTIKGKTFSFENRPYLIEIYENDAKQIIIVKPRQMEITEFAINWLLYHLIMNRVTVGLYLTDREKHVSVFSKLRLHSWAIESSPILKSLAEQGNVHHLPLKNGSHLFMASAWTDFESARSYPADFVVIDEIQSTNPAALPVVLETLSKSEFGKILIIGTGSVEGDSWHNKWMQGNQSEWDMTKQKWIPKNPDSKIPSYHLSQYMAPWKKREEIEEKRRTYTPQLFSNEVEGWWYKGMRKPLTKEEIVALFDSTLEFTDDELVDHSMPVFMGVDWGGGVQAFTVPWIWQLIDDKVPRFKLLYTTRIEERSTEKQADKVALLMDKFGVDQMVMDAGGGTRQVEKLSNRYGERVYTCSYTYKADDPYEEVPHTTKLSVDRTWAIENIIDLITRPEKRSDYPKPIPRVIIPSAEYDKVEWLIDHFTCIEAETKQTFGRSHVVYTHPEETNDDALHAMVYAYLAYLKHKNTRWIGGSL